MRGEYVYRTPLSPSAILSYLRSFESVCNIDGFNIYYRIDGMMVKWLYGCMHTNNVLRLRLLSLLITLGVIGTEACAQLNSCLRTVPPQSSLQNSSAPPYYLV